MGETPTWGIQQEALLTSLNIAWTLDVKKNTADPDHEPVIRLLAPTFSGTADSLARVLRTWAAQGPDRREGADLGLLWRGNRHRQALFRAKRLPARQPIPAP